MYVYELARELGLEPSAVGDRSKELGLGAAWSGATLTDDEETQLRSSLVSDPPAAPAPGPAPAVGSYDALAASPAPAPAVPAPAAPAGFAGGYASPAVPSAPAGGPLQTHGAPSSYPPPGPIRPPAGAYAPGFSPGVATAARMPTSGGCKGCGRGPTAQARFEYGVGMLIMHQTHKFEGRFCRNCGLALYKKAMGKTLVLGWWGLISALIYNWIHIFVNLSNKGKVKRLQPPQ